jgi:hypothetical protein
MVIGHPHTLKRGKLLTNLQHAFLMQETIVVVVFWGILFPILGLNGGGKGEPSHYFTYMMIYKHTVPFLSMLHDFLCSQGEFSKTGVYICMVIYLVYFVYNLILNQVFGIVVYNTKYTSGNCKCFRLRKNQLP